MRTRLELFIQSHGVKPARLAAEASYSRGHLARAREGEPTSLRFQEGVTAAILHIVGQPVTRTELFEPEGVAIRTLFPKATHDRSRKPRSPHSAMPKDLETVAENLADTELEAWLAGIRRTAGAASETSIRELVDAASPLINRQPARAELLYAAANRAC